MTDKNYNTLPDIYETFPIEEAKNNFDTDKSKVLTYTNNLESNPDKYFEDKVVQDKRNNSYEIIEKNADNQVQNKKGDDMLLSLRTHSYVGHISEAPKFSRDNEFILRGYRVNFHTCETIAKSLCLCHNETVNVWTHLVGALFTVILIIITGVAVGPYGSKVNQPWRAENRKIYFEKYSVPFYSSLPIFHNSRNFLTYLNLNLKKMSNNNKMTSNSNSFIEKDYNRIESFLQTCLEDHSSINDEIDNIKDDIDCASCIEDFIRNLLTIKDYVEEAIKNIDNVNTQNTQFKDSNKDKLISLKDIIEKILVKMNNKTKNLKILNEYINLSEYGRYGYETDSFYSNVRLVKWPIHVQLVCAIICLSCSSAYHLFMAYSHKVVEILARLDYAGISILIAGSCFPCYYYFYYCDIFYRAMYLGFISGFAFIVFLCSLTPSFNKPEKRKLRGWLFLLLGISTAVPIIHLTFFFNPKIGMMDDSQLSFWFIGGGVYISGCLIYIFRFPERYFPGKFDLIGSSHQIWHIFVLGGIIFHHFACLNTYFDRLNHECPS